MVMLKFKDIVLSTSKYLMYLCRYQAVMLYIYRCLDRFRHCISDVLAHRLVFLPHPSSLLPTT